jgi:hypothetical protein
VQCGARRTEGHLQTHKSQPRTLPSAQLICSCQQLIAVETENVLGDGEWTWQQTLQSSEIIILINVK